MGVLRKVRRSKGWEENGQLEGEKYVAVIMDFGRLFEKERCRELYSFHQS